MTSRGRIKDQPLRYIRGHNSVGMNRSKPYKTHYAEEDRGYVSPCWIWQMAKTKPNARSSGGYGKLRVKGRDFSAHRYYYEQAHGSIPKGMQVDHLCRNRDCVNPAHMEVVTPLENSRRGTATKLSLEQARVVEHLTAEGFSSNAIGGLFGVSRQTVDLIRRNGTDGPRRVKR